jgi:hypothetical protein
MRRYAVMFALILTGWTLLGAAPPAQKPEIVVRGPLRCGVLNEPRSQKVICTRGRTNYILRRASRTASGNFCGYWVFSGGTPERDMYVCTVRQGNVGWRASADLPDERDQGSVACAALPSLCRAMPRAVWLRTQDRSNRYGLLSLSPCLAPPSSFTASALPHSGE